VIEVRGKSGKRREILLEVRENIGHLIACGQSKNITVVLLYFYG